MIRCFILKFIKENILWCRIKREILFRSNFFFFTSTNNSSTAANTFDKDFCSPKYKRLNSTWIKGVLINANHKLSERHFQSWSWVHSCLNAWIPLALISVLRLYTKKKTGRNFFSFFLFPFSFTKRARERIWLTWRDNGSFSFLPTKVNFILKRCPGLSQSAVGEPRQIFLRPAPLAWHAHFQLCEHSLGSFVP